MRSAPVAWPHRINCAVTCLVGIGIPILPSCQTTGPRTDSTEAAPLEPSVEERTLERCALSKEPLSSEFAIRLFAGEAIRFRSESEATTFDELPGERKRVIAGQQVLARRGVANADCPVSQKPLPIDATIIDYEGVQIGFSSSDEQKRFQALPRNVQIRMVARYLLRSDGIPNDRCPISDLVLLPGSPSLQVADVRIAFADQTQLEAFQEMPPPQRNEIAARILMPERGVSNTTCPITRQPIRLDSPVILLDGQRIALRNVQAARTFNGMPIAEQRAMVIDEGF